MTTALELMNRSTLPSWLARLFLAVHGCQSATLDERCLAALLSWLGLARTEDGLELVRMPEIVGVGFTGSRKAGLSLKQAADETGPSGLWVASLM